MVSTVRATYLVVIECSDAACDLKLPHVPCGFDRQQGVDDRAGGHAETDTQPCQTECFRECAEHVDMFVLPGQMDVASRVGVVSVCLVEHYQGMRRSLDDAANVCLAQPGARRAVRIGDENDSCVVIDCRDVGIDIKRH